jgi:hypothetical protein
MYQNKLTNRLGDDLYVSARKERGTVFLQMAEGEKDEALMMSLNYDEYIELRQMLTEAFSEMGW